MPERSRQASMLLLSAEIALHALIVTCPLSLGSAPRWVLWPLVGLSSLCVVLIVIANRRRSSAVQLPLIVLMPALLVACCLLQLVPLPAAVLGVASPFAASLREFALLPLDLTGPRPTTLDAPSTWRELAKSISYLFVVIGALQLSTSRDARRRLTATVALTGGLVAAIGLCHRLVDADALFGFYRFSFTPTLLTPFGNVNHLCGFLTVAALAALGVGLTHHERPRQLLWMMVALVCVSATFVSGSRGGTIFLTAGLGLFFVGEWRRRVNERTGREASMKAVVLGITFIAIVGVSAYLAWETLVPRLDSVSSFDKLHRTKVEMWPAMARGAMAFWPLGMGRGAYELGFTPFQLVDSSVLFTHPENVVLQLTSELGVPIAALILAIMATVAWRLAGLSTRGSLENGAFAALVAVGLHDCFDFALEFPATAVAAGVLCASAFGSGTHRELGARLAAPAVLALAALAVFAAMSSRPDFRDAEAEVAMAERAGLAPAELEAKVRTLVDRHPADYVLYVAAARALSTREGQPQLALAWVNRALFLRPVDVESHRFAARALLRLGKRSQGFLEYRLAGDGRSRTEAVRNARSLADLEVLGDSAVNRVEVAQELRRQNRPREALELLSAAERDPALTTADSLVLAAELAVQLKDFGAARATLERAALLAPDSAQVMGARAQLSLGEGKTDEAIGLYRSLTVKHPEESSYAFALAQVLLNIGRTREARDVLTRVSPFVVSPSVRAQKMMLEAQSYEGDRSWMKAIGSYQSAARLVPGWGHPHFQAATLYERIGKYDEAQREVHAGVRASGGNLSDTQRAWLDRLRAAAEERALRAPTGLTFDE